MVHTVQGRNNPSTLTCVGRTALEPFLLLLLLLLLPPPAAPFPGTTFYLNLNTNFPRRRPITVVVDMPGMLPGPSRCGLTWPSLRGVTSKIAWILWHGC